MQEPRVSSPDNWVQFDGALELSRASGPIAIRTVKIPSPFFMPLDDTGPAIASPPIMERKKWILFNGNGADPSISSDSKDFHKLPASHLHDIQVSTESNEDQPTGSRSALQDVKGLPSIVKAKAPGGFDEQVLLRNDSASDSELSDEIVDLDYESDDAKRLRNSPVKKYADLTLFTAKSLGKSSPAQSSQSNSPIRLLELRGKMFSPCTAVATSVLDQYPDFENGSHFNLFCRYPHQKKIMGSRKWVSVKLSIEDNFIKLIGTLNGSDISKEIPLHPFFVFTVPKVHGKENGSKLIAIKMQYVKYRETRHFIPGYHFEHTPTNWPVLKLGSSNFLHMQEFVRQAESVIRKIPLSRDTGIAYRHQEIFIDCDDDCQFLLSGNGDILKHNISVHMRVRAFLTGKPELRMFLNDFRHKDKLAVRCSSEGQQVTPNVWMEPEECEYHPCVDSPSSELEGSLLFTPPDGCSFELLRIRVINKKPLPILVKCSLRMLTANVIKFEASLQAVGDAKSLRRRRNNVVLYMPISEQWERYFYVNKGISGQKCFLSAKSKDGCRAASVRKGSVAMEISSGKAEYEPAYGSLVWRLGSLPILSSKIPADAEHKFSCMIDVPSGSNSIELLHPFAYVAYDIPHTVGSDIHVQELLLSNAQMPEKWVSYQATFFYKICVNTMSLHGSPGCCGFQVL